MMRVRRLRVSSPIALGLLLVSASSVMAQDDADVALAQQLSNPVAALVSVPFQFNYDGNIGPNDDGNRVYLNFQPVIPMGISDDWNVISRTILPVTWQEDIFPGAGSQFGLGDTTQSLFLSPVKPAFGKIIWGAGPVFLLPTATDDLLGSDQWGVGPTAVVLTQAGPWTIGMLANHIWSVAGDSDQPDVNNTYLQPFLSYTTPTAWTFTLNTESNYNWETDDWAVPVNGLVSKLVSIAGQRVQFGAGARYWVDSSTSGPEGFGARLVVTFLFPR
jgi:hypothetical protein